MSMGKLGEGPGDRVLLYHTTPSVHVPSILREGLHDRAYGRQAEVHFALEPGDCDHLAARCHWTEASHTAGLPLTVFEVDVTGLPVHEGFDGPDSRALTGEAACTGVTPDRLRVIKQYVWTYEGGIP